MADTFTVILSCEHATNHIPSPFRYLFLNKEGQKALNSHRGFDAGAVQLGQAFAERYSISLHAGQCSRLLIDLNRSEHHRSLFSEFSSSLTEEERHSLITEIHRPYRENIIRDIERAVMNGHRILHLSIHSFTPVMNSTVRRPDVALLYDPRRKAEKRFAELYIRSMKRYSDASSDQEAPGSLVFGRNDPYRGRADGCTTSMRKRFDGQHYTGIEIEINQKHLCIAETHEKSASASHFPPALTGMLLDCLPISESLED